MSDYHPYPQLQRAVSYSLDPVRAAKDLQQQLATVSGLQFVLFFCSAEYELPVLAAELKAAFGDLAVAGCTTAGELTPDGYGQSCITAIGFGDSAFSVSATLLEDMANFDLSGAQKTVEDLTHQCRQRNIAPTKGHTFVLTLLDGLSSLEELFLANLNAALGSIVHFGGSAGDDIHLANTHVYWDGAFHNQAAVVIMVNTSREFKVFSSHHMESRDQKLVVTRASAESRTVYQLNAEPAAEVYAKAVGVPVDQLDHNVFALNPLAVRMGQEYYVRSIQRVNEDLSLTFYCAVENGIVLTAMKPGDMLADIEQVLAKISQQIGDPELVLGCDCFLRRLELEHQGEKAAMSELLQRHRVVGFNTYGEQIGGMHINQTFTAVAIGRDSR